MMAESAHRGHRQRMRQRVEQQGFDSLSPHEALEVILYITNAQRDTNAIAHALLERFGDFAAVLDATEEELCAVEGMGPASARMLHLLPAVSQYYTHCRTQGRVNIRTTAQLEQLLRGRFGDMSRERVLLAAIDQSSRIQGSWCLAEGEDTLVRLSVKDVVSAALRGGTDRVVLCHNHPNGLCYPSPEDLQSTENIVRALATVRITLLDHIILTEDDYFSMREENRLPLFDFETGTMIRPY